MIWSNSCPHNRAKFLLHGRLERTRALDRRLAAFAGAYANNVVQRHDENFSVAELTRASSFDNYLNSGVFDLIRYDHFDFDLWNKFDLVFRAAVSLGMTALASVTLHFADRHSDHFHFLERRSNSIQ